MSGIENLAPLRHEIIASCENLQTIHVLFLRLAIITFFLKQLHFFTYNSIIYITHFRKKKLLKPLQSWKCDSSQFSRTKVARTQFLTIIISRVTNQLSVFLFHALVALEIHSK